MKRTIHTALVSLTALAALGQGSVTFQNASTIAGWSPATNRNVTFGYYVPNSLLTPGANVSSNHGGLDLSSLRAALYYAPGTVSDANWSSVNNLAMPTTGGSGFATFKQSTSTTAGSWFGGTRTMAGIPIQNGIASLMVVVWDSRLSSDPFHPYALGGVWGRSSVFSYTTPSSGTPAPAEFMMHNLRSFEVFGIGPSPEPTVAMFAGLGATILFLVRRQRNP